MMDDTLLTICCDKCGHEYVRIEYINEKRVVTVHPPQFNVQVISKNPDIFGTKCPACSHTTILDTDLIRNL